MMSPHLERVMSEPAQLVRYHSVSERERERERERKSERAQETFPHLPGSVAGEEGTGRYHRGPVSYNISQTQLSCGLRKPLQQTACTHSNLYSLNIIQQGNIHI